MRRIAAILLMFLVALPSYATTYYISSSTGLDSRTTTQAQSKSTPWAHVPGMANATGNAASYTAAPGDTFVLLGCDIWYNASFPLALNNGGSSGNVVTVGVDQTWYNATNCPSAWNRPIFDAHTSSGSITPTQIGGTTTGCGGVGFNEFVNFSASYITMNWIEMRNFYYSNDAENSCYGGNSFWQVNDADYVTVSNTYEHAWSMGTYSTSPPVNDTDTLVFIEGSPQCPHCLMTYNVADNCATTSGSGTQPGGAVDMTNIRYSIFKCMSNAYKPTLAGEFGWNEISYNGESPDPTIHANMIESISATGNSGIYYIHDNRIHDNYDGEGLQVGNPGETDYVWNNIWWNDTAVGSNGPQVPQSETPVAMYFWNNVVVDWNSCITNAGHGYTWSGAFHSQNNFCVNTAGTNSSGSPTASTVTIGNNLGMTITTATADGYTASQSFVYSPVSGSVPTVGYGTNLTSLWPAGFSTEDSHIVCTEQTVSGVVESVCTGTQNTRPSTGAWDAGAYEYSGAMPMTPTAPPNLSILMP